MGGRTVLFNKLTFHFLNIGYQAVWHRFYYDTTAFPW